MASDTLVTPSATSRYASCESVAVDQRDASQELFMQQVTRGGVAQGTSTIEGAV